MIETVGEIAGRCDVERMARAMCAEGGFDPGEIMPNDGPRWRYYVPGVRAVLRAMREPSEFAMDCGAYHLPGIDTAAKQAKARDVYRAMINAALDEHP